MPLTVRPRGRLKRKRTNRRQGASDRTRMHSLHNRKGRDCSFIRQLPDCSRLLMPLQVVQNYSVVRQGVVGLADSEGAFNVYRLLDTIPVSAYTVKRSRTGGWSTFRRGTSSTHRGDSSDDPQDRPWSPDRLACNRISDCWPCSFSDLGADQQYGNSHRHRSRSGRSYRAKRGSPTQGSWHERRAQS